MLGKALRFAIGLTIGFAIWKHATPAYDRLLAAGAQPLIRIDHRLQNAFVVADGAAIQATGPDLPPVRVPAAELTYNMILLFGLFATSPPRRRTFLGFAIGIAILVATHVLAVVVSTNATFIARGGPWSDARYSSFEQDLWTAAEYSYRLAGMFAIVFACWWVAEERTEKRAG